MFVTHSPNFNNPSRTWEIDMSNYDDNRPIYTPWGWANPAYDVEPIADGVDFISTASHGGLRLTPERIAQIPADIRKTMRGRKWFEEDCETPIILTVLGLANESTKKSAIMTATHFENYQPCLPFLT